MAAPSIQARQTGATLIVEVRSEGRAIAQAEVTVRDQVAVTDGNGIAQLQVLSGDVEVRIQRYGFAAKTLTSSILPGSTTRLAIELEAEAVQKEEITVTATRTDMRIEEEPLHVEVLNKEEVEEKTLMTPGDIAMMLNETSGVRVQVTDPSLGAANVRIQGLRGRYTQVLADGLPLYGGQTGGIGLLQIPPLDLGQVEVLKGVASALYGPSALGGVINLVSRRPRQPEKEFLVNRTSRGATDSVFWLAHPVENKWGYSLLGGAHFQEKKDIDHDGWADLAGYRRAVVRPRVYWDNGKGKSVFATAGAMAENREGGTIGNATVANGQHFPETLDTRRFDTGIVGRVAVGSRLLSVRGSAMTQSHRHQFGDTQERDRQETLFGEAALSGTNSGHTWVMGSAMQADLYRSHDVQRLDYTYLVPGVFVQDDYAIRKSVTLSGSGRLDDHNKYGTFFNPRISALIRLPHHWTARTSTGTGVFVPSPFTEETEAVGLSRLSPLMGVQAERAVSASGDLGWSASHLELNGSVFGSVVRHPLFLRQSLTGSPQPLEIVNASAPTRTVGSEALARIHGGPFALVLTHTFVHSTEIDRQSQQRLEAPLTPRHTAGIVGTWESESNGRIGLEMFYTGQQRLEDNPYRAVSRPYCLFGALVEKRFGALRLFVNAENLANVRQTRYNPLLRSTPSFDGQWTVDAWAPLDGRVINGGLRFGF